ncbi:MAG: hypothetical protein A3G25_19070 [Betaproteobacteria bacterium RIFCSPLOWO2_12_FULL_63_13]|nr:MAG: hypothetical protein A3G25_19070 [Betaproteobacteria bacterium RIFCSPLOWO2_12_FULL_63_13]
MNSVKSLVAIFACLALLAGCATGPVSEITNPFAGLFQSSEADQALSTGIKQFEEGAYAVATRNLRRALELGLASDSDRIKAHKYLAFTHCVSSRLSACRDEFAKALKIDPSMELEPSERGHPIWGPQFRSAKTRN